MNIRSELTREDDKNVYLDADVDQAGFRQAYRQRYGKDPEIENFGSSLKPSFIRDLAKYEKPEPRPYSMKDGVRIEMDDTDESDKYRERRED